MRSHDPSDSASPSSSSALDEFAAETPDRSVRERAPLAGGVFSLECEAQPEPELSVSGPLLDFAPAEVSHDRGQPLSRIEAREARRRNGRKVPGRRLATPVVAVKNSMTRVRTTVEGGARYASTAAARHVVGVRQRSIDSAAFVSQRTSSAVRHGRRLARQLALRMGRRAAASRTRMVAERETITQHAYHGFVVLARTIADVTHRSMDAAFRLAQRLAGAIRDGGRASSRLAVEIRTQAAARKEQTRLIVAVAQNRTHGAAMALAAAVLKLTHRSTEAASRLFQRVPPFLGACTRAVHRFALVSRSRQIAAAKSVTAHCARVSMSASRAWAVGTRPFSRPFTQTALAHQEFNGLVVAVMLAVAVIGYGGFVAVSWRTPTAARVTGATAPQKAGETPVTPALAVPMTAARSLVQASAGNTPAVVRTNARDIEPSTAFGPSVRTLTALWQRRDTRSLDRAFATLRRETLAFRSCGMRMTDADRAVARCEGVVTELAANGAPSSRSGIWTIDFQRTGGRWQIARVATR